MKDEEDRFEDFLHQLMQEGGEEKAPSGFTQRVMGQITAPQAVPVRTKWKPVVTWKGWLAAVVGLVVTFIASFWIPSSNNQAVPGKETAEKAIDATLGIVESIHFPVVWVVGLGAILALFTLDRFLSARAKS